ncbi:MAG TPA: zinc-binding alcohol dehydrogenase [Steroidobacteraceae bacterium]|nr:zinc-binding alcohol dehydrogenase [Steroidobacteraceae bacterium]
MSGHDTLAFWVAAPGRGELRRETLPAPRAGEASVSAVYSGVSRGTEALVFNGSVPAGDYQRMRAPFQAGDFPGPVKYGYANVGIVVEGPSHLSGKAVFCLYPHQQHYIVPTHALYPLPECVPAARAVLAANLETALNAVWDSGAAPGDRVTVVGAGSIGCLVAWLLGRVPGCNVELIDTNPQRRAIADAFGIAFAQPATATPEADVVLHTSGSGEGLALALQLAAFEATICECSWYGTRSVSLALGEAFHSRRLVLKSSQVGSVAAAHRARWTPRRRMELALSLLADPALDVLINSEGTLEDLPHAMQRLARTPGDTIMHRVSYGAAV